jgi:hypothetical protein
MGQPTIATNPGRSQQASAGAAAAQAALAKQAGVRGSDISGDAPRKSVGYGLPCAKCHLYYPADLDVCPTCQHNERVSPIVPKIPPKRVEAAPEPIPDNDILEQEREEFLRQFKAQLLQAHAETGETQEVACKFGENHPGESSAAEICAGCYERLQERLDVCEGALHMDLKEAAQIVYDAVWADPSDPGKTYQNAASALLTEVRKRAGLTSLRGPFQPLAH